ncbi:hypothetical protein B0H19DRAFT_241550 [Mycena capillaripes]|nr:hypothetical protein B0H19DRAFT_241550 [Mycena capillaripes]
MHAGLRIREIVDSVVSGLDAEFETAELAALAQTCTIFHEPALDALWRNQDDLRHLLRCMPDDIWETMDDDGVTPIPRRPIVPSDWDRVSKYAPRIKSLRCDDLHDYPMMGVYQAIRQYLPGSYLLPNLEHLGWNHGYSSYIELFLGPRLKSITIGWQEDGTYPPLATLAQTHPGLVSVEIKGVNGDSEESERVQLYSFVRSLTHLEELEVRTIDAETLKYLGRLPTLKTLRAVLSDSVAFPDVPNGSMFSHLRTANFRPEQDPGGGIVPLLALLCTWKNPQLMSFEADVFDSRGLEDVERLYQLLAGHIAHDHLEMLQLEIMQPEPPVIAVHPGGLFKPLFSFTRLTVMELMVPVGYDFDDATVAEMARAWPAIEELGLRSRTNHEPRCTLLALESFARHCPNMWLLSITLDASSMPATLGTDDGVLPQQKLKRLDLAWSRISTAAVAAVPAFLSGLFANLTQITTDMGQLWDEGDEEGQKNHERWMEVERLVQGLVERREKELE